MDAEIDALLAELTRFQSADAATTTTNGTPESLRKFSVAAPSPFAPEHVQIIANEGADSSVSHPFLLPSLPTRRADATIVHQETEQHFMRPLYALTGAVTANTALQVPHGSMLASGGSRLLPQVAMAPSRTQLVPTRENLVANPLRLSYEYRDVDVASGGGASSVLEGFSEAMKKQDEYAKQNIGKQPHAPGGNALTEQDGRTSSAAHTASASVVMTPEARALNALVLSGDTNADDDDALARLVIQAPGLDDCLTLKDLREAQRAKLVVVAAGGETQSPLAAVGANPTHLLRPYLEIVSDQDTLRAMQHSIADEKAFLAMQKTSADNGGSGMVALDELLHDLEDDEELKAMGFRLDNDDDDGDDAAVAENGSDDDSEENKNKRGGDESTEEPAAMLEPEAEVELLLRDAHVSSSNPKRKTTKLSEWASMQSVDVRNFHEKVPEMAMQYGFELDTFQKECVIHLERHECVFVAAHTSAGKTVVAEYAIAMSQKHMTRTIYTSPIKALSNQKYRDFREKYGPQNVGLITGDVSLNPDASCLVMTTEILRSMLYRGADVIRDIEWVIFDEIHYINDSERGVVWEEVIIMLPEHVGMVFLSATTPNHLEFSDWIGRTKKKKIHVISTYKRPVPLQHYLYAGKELFKLFDAASGYNANAYGAAKTKLFPPSDKPVKGSATGRAGGGGSGRGGASSGRTMGRTSGGDQSDWTKLVSSLKEKALLPVVVFAFSKRLCEESANKLNKLDLSTPSERSEIHLFLENSIQRLQGSDRELPQVLTMKEMLKRGIGVHHGGLLPIIKEMVEILFGRGLVKVLFSTETFAMGVNMPARTVVFNGIRKHDGKSFRDLLPGEYTQMAGRAGRRGLDSVGTVIIACWNDLPEPTSLQTMLAGKATMLSSQFRLTYNMILNLLRVEVLSVEDMMKRSFSEFHTQKALASKQVPQLIQRGKHLLKTLEGSLTDEYPTLESSGELAQIHDFYDLKRQKRELEKKLVKWMLTNHVQAARAAIAPGRVVLVNVKGLPSDHFALVVRTQSAGSDADAGAGGARFSSKLGFDSISGDPGASGSSATGSTGGRARSLFKTITVVCLCPEDYEPPKTKTKTEDHVGSAFGALKRDPFSGSAGCLLKSKKDDDSMMMMMGRGKKSGGSASKLQLVDDDAEELQTNVKSSLLGKQYAVIDIPESCIDLISCEQASTKSINVKNLAATSSKKELAAVVEFLVQLDKQSAQSKKSDVAFVDVLTELKVNDLEVATAYSAWQQLYAGVLTHACAAADSPSQSRVLNKVEKICKLKDYITRLTRELSNDSLSLFPDFQQRQGVLKKLGYISDDGVVQVKGRVACEINTCEEIVLTEMIFENVLANLEPEEIVAVLSALIFQEKTQNEPTLTPRLEHARDTVKQIAESLGVIQLEQHLEIDPAVYCKGALNFGLMEVVYEWARGKSFKELCEITDVQEGSIVRCITRLDEVCREVRNAARVIGDPSLFRKMEVASEAIKRDVVFASSLYLS